MLQILMFFASMIRKKPPVLDYVPFEFEGNQARYYSCLRKNKGLMVIFPGASPLGFADPRYQRLILALTRLGYHALILQIQAQEQMRLGDKPQIEQLAACLIHLLTRSLPAFQTLSFIGPSSATAYLMHLATHPFLALRVKSLLLISPFYQLKRSIQRLLEEPGSVYGQLLSLKLILQAQMQDQPQALVIDELDYVDKLIHLAHLHQDQLDIPTLVALMPEQNKSLVGFNQRLEQLGQAGFISEQLSASLDELSQDLAFEQRLPSLKASVTILHAEEDDVFSPEESVHLARDLRSQNIDTHLLVTKLLNHANLSPKYMLQEFFAIYRALNHFFNSVQPCQQST